MFHDRMRRTGVPGRLGIIAVLISSMAVLGGCDTMRPFGDTILGGLGAAGKAAVRAPGESEGDKARAWRTELITVTRQ